jgi:hypothetical protein
MRNFLAHYGLSIPMGHDVFEPALDSSKLSITQTVDTLEMSPQGRRMNIAWQKFNSYYN